MGRQLELDLGLGFNVDATLNMDRKTRARVLGELAATQGVSRATIYRRLAEAREGRQHEDGRSRPDRTRLEQTRGPVWNQIAELRRAGVRPVDIAARLGVSRSTVLRVQRRFSQAAGTGR